MSWRTGAAVLVLGCGTGCWRCRHWPDWALLGAGTHPWPMSVNILMRCVSHVAMILGATHEPRVTLQSTRILCSLSVIIPCLRSQLMTSSSSSLVKRIT